MDIVDTERNRDDKTVYRESDVTIIHVWELHKKDTDEKTLGRHSVDTEPNRGKGRTLFGLMLLKALVT